MKKAKFLLLTLLAVLGYSGAWADTVNNYTVDFNTAIATSSHDFAVASKWGHIVGTNDYDGMGPYYMSYSHNASSGVESTGALLAYQQYAGDSGGGGVVYDLLVTPTVSGTITLQVKAYGLASSSNNAFVEFYATDGTTRGELLKTVKEEIPGYNTGNNTEWITATLEVAEAQKIGIRAQYVYLDNFTASQMESTAEKSLAVTKVANLAGYDGTGGSTTYFYQQADGTLKVQLKVTLENNGDIDIEAGEVTLTAARASYASGTKTYYEDAAVTVNEAIAAGETKTVDVDFYVPYPSSNEWNYWFVKESITGTTSSSSRYAGNIAYVSKFVFREAGSTSTSSLSGTQNWGTINESTTKNYEIYNDGTAPLIVNSITIPEGFTSTALEGNSSVRLIANGAAADGAVFYAWTWGDGVADHWVPCNADGVFEDLAENFLIARINPNNTPSDMNTWGGEVWNQSDNFTLEGGGWVFDYFDNGRMKGHFVAAVVEPKSAKAIDITQDASELGTYSGTLEIKYLNASNTETTYTLGIAASVIAEGTWFADFNSGTSAVAYPEGSIAEYGIMTDYDFANNAYNPYIKGRSQNTYANENNKFITPLLHANAGDQLSFDLKRGSYSSATYTAKVYVSTDRVNWGEPVFVTNASELTSSFQTKNITFSAEGDYYVAFALYDICLDNIIGLQKVDVAHDLYIKEVTWQDATVNSGQEISSRPKVTIIPLTNETADSYTVKYIYGDNVVEGTPVALTASATSTKDFTFTFTPEVESTTTFEGTKVVFEFTDGTKIETEPYTFTVKNEPKFHFVKTLPSKWNEPSDYTTPITFGKTNTVDKQTFYILNWGSAPLTVKSVSLPDGFSASVETPLTVALFDGTNEGVVAASQALDITFSATDAGTYSGDMVITYVDGAGEDATFTIAVSGTKLDNTKWYANFDDNKWPAGSTYQSNVSMTDGGTYSVPNYYISSSSTTNNLFITPKLTATAGEKIQFDAKYYNSYNTSGKVVVYAAATRDELLDTEVEKTPIFTTEGMTTDYQTFTVTIPEAGDYYLGFEISNRPYVDEIYGLTLAEAGLDLAIASSNIPDEGMQNKPVSATLNVKNYGLEEVAEEDYLVMVGIGDIASSAEQGPAVLPMTPSLSAAGTQLPITFQSPKPGTYPVTIYITDLEGNILAETEAVEVTFAEEEVIGELVIGAGTTTSTTYAPIDFVNLESLRTSDILYTAAQLSRFGLQYGDKITAITFKGSCSSGKDMGNSPLTAWVALSEGDITYNSPVKDAMQKVDVYAAGEMVFTSGENLITINLPETITYDGTSDLRVYLEGGGDGKWISLSFAYDTNYQNMKWSNSSSMKYNPLAYLTLDVQTATLSGTVTDAEGQPIEGATVTLESGTVQYEGTTEADGSYSINVIQTGRIYDVTASAEGYDDAVKEDVSFAEGDQVVNFTLTQTPEFVEVTITSAGLATFSSIYPLDFTDSDVKAYVITGKEGSKFKSASVTMVPENTGIIVKGAEGTYQVPVAAEEPDDIESNLLVSTAEGAYTTTEADYGYVYGLFQTTAGKIGFQKKKVGWTCLANRCYVRLPEASSAESFSLDFDTTGIFAIDSNDDQQNGATYNLNGQRVNASHKGIVIRDGKKQVQK